MARLALWALVLTGFISLMAGAAAALGGVTAPFEDDCVLVEGFRSGTTAYPRLLVSATNGRVLAQNPIISTPLRAPNAERTLWITTNSARLTPLVRGVLTLDNGMGERLIQARLTNGQAEWSPDSRLFAYLWHDEAGAQFVTIADPDGSPLRTDQLSVGGEAVLFELRGFSADGAYLAYSRQPRGGVTAASLVFMPTGIPPDPTFTRPPDSLWSSTGHRALVQDVASGSVQIVDIAAGLEAGAAFNEPTVRRQNLPIQWSPAGDAAFVWLFSPDPFTVEQFNAAIDLYRADGTRRTNLAQFRVSTGQRPDSRIVWSDDGAALIYWQGERFQPYSLIRYDLANEQMTALVDDAAHTGVFSFSGRYAAYFDIETALRVVDMFTGRIAVVASDFRALDVTVPFDPIIQWASDDSGLLTIRYDERRLVWSTPDGAHGGDVRFAGLPAGDWQAGGRHYAFAYTDETGALHLNVIDFSAGERRAVASSRPDQRTAPYIETGQSVIGLHRWDGAAEYFEFYDLQGTPLIAATRPRERQPNFARIDRFDLAPDGRYALVVNASSSVYLLERASAAARPLQEGYFYRWSQTGALLTAVMSTSVAVGTTSDDPWLMVIDPASLRQYPLRLPGYPTAAYALPCAELPRRSAFTYLVAR